jgi:hypothetical protein
MYIEKKSNKMDKNYKLQQKFIDIEVEYLNKINIRAEQRDER